MEKDLVREARLRAGLTQAQLAERVGTTQSAIARVERGGSIPSLARVRELVAACGLELRIRLAERVPIPAVHVAGTASTQKSADVTAEVVTTVRVLDRHQVQWIVAGGMAAALHGASDVGTAMTVVPREGRRNLQALSASLDELGARVRVDGGSLPFERDAAAILAAGRLSLTSTGGPFDLDLRPPGTFGYADLVRGAVAMRRSGVDLLVASLADVVRMTDAAEWTDDDEVAALRRRLAARGTDRR